MCGDCSNILIGFRGKGGAITFYDEAEIANAAMRKQGVAPTLSVDNSSLICFSSAVNKKDSWMQRYFDDPKYAAKNSTVRAITLNRLCSRCRKKTPVPTHCEHDAHLLPQHQDPKRASMIQDLMNDGDEDDSHFQQEYLNIPQDHAASLFDKAHIEQLLNKPRISQFGMRRLFHDPSNVTVLHFVDPNGGSGKAFEGRKAHTSRLGIVSLVMNCPEPGACTIVGKVAFPTNDDERVSQVVDQYCAKLLEDEFLSRARHLLAVEPNFGGVIAVSSYLGRFRRSMADILQYSDRPKGIGVVTTRENKMAAGHDFLWKVRSGKFFLYDQPFEEYALAMLPESLGPKLEPGHVRYRWTRSDVTLYEELMRFQFKHDNFTAKTATASDDMVIALMMGHFHLRCHLQDRGYAFRGMEQSHQDQAWSGLFG